ncbi:cytochrome P450 [Dichomitus squalens LYAD-421 SS1]|uniref:cytochrome P450 n=1 Tax=Dichomitus squalens (strain LYAD-421) TaxID=732165 RepID=UPI0004414CB0|nr:cytochrome P450 [Dichomitus squalens LYAD-421 SS1]EJF64290.1 cytochrome P450 [Dichomitus squalens LYAD-421 SS1]
MTTLHASFTSSFSILDVVLLSLAALAYGVHRLLRVPSHLRHIPTVPLWPLMKSYLLGECEEQRVKRLVLPFAKENNTHVVLVFCLGDWMVQVLEPKIGKELLENPAVRKQQQPDDMLLWRLIGRNNVFMSDGEMWKRQSRIMRDALRQTTPIDVFTSLARTTFSLIGDGGRVRWSDYTNRYTLDAVGTTVIGYDFEALAKPHGNFVRRYHDVMSAIASPAYVVLPSLERWLPRWSVRKMVDSFVDDFCKILQEKREKPGNDVITHMFQEPGMTEVEYRDNAIVTFIGGHDTTAGALATTVYFLARFQDIQAKLREEVHQVLGDEDPRADHYHHTPYLNAIIRESMRYNTPTNVTVPRIADVPVQVGGYMVPAGTAMALNMCAAHHNEAVWSAPAIFDPDRFLDEAKIDSGNWVSFGLGPRRCPAKNFSLYEQRVLISMLLREYRWTLPDDSPHRDFLKNGFSAFALSLPDNVEIDFVRIAPNTTFTPM